MDFSGASREENEPKVVGIGPDQNVVNWFVVFVSFPRDVPKQELFRTHFDDIVQGIFYKVVEFTLVEGGTKLKEVVKIAGDCRGFSAALYLGFSMEVYPVVFRVEVVVLSKAMGLKEFLGLKVACLLSEQQAQSVRH